MKVEVIEKRANQVRLLICPVCGKEATIVIEEGRTAGSLHCWFCSSLLGWSISDEVKPVEEKVEAVQEQIEVVEELISEEGEEKVEEALVETEVKKKKVKKDVKPEETE